MPRRERQHLLCTLESLPAEILNTAIAAELRTYGAIVRVDGANWARTTRGEALLVELQAIAVNRARRKRRVTITPEMRVEIRARYARGATQASLAYEYYLSPKSIQRILK